MNYYKHHLGDYDSNTAHLSWLEDCAYRRLICLYYRIEKPLPRDVAAVARLVRAQGRAELRAVGSVLEEFFELRDDGWHNKRCDDELEKYRERAQKNRESGEKGGRPPKDETQSVSKDNPNGFPESAQLEPNGNPSQQPQPLATSHYVVVDDGGDPIAAAMDAVFSACDRNPNLVNLARVRRWLEVGCDLQLDILPAIAACRAKKEPGWVPRNLRYFDQPVADAKAQRLAPMPEGKTDGKFPDLPAFLDRRKPGNLAEIQQAVAQAKVSRG